MLGIGHGWNVGRNWCTAAAGMIVLLAAGATCAAEFSYSGDTGPGFWGQTPGWEACAGAGGRQSPVDIRTAVPDPALRHLSLQLNPTPLSLLNNGHVIEQEYEPGSFLVLNGTTYQLAQFHFHTLSEHTIGGQRGLMEMHAVFRDPASSNIAVVGTLFRLGRENRFLNQLLAKGLPQHTGERVSDATILVNVADGLTDTRFYYTYPGSLTTPPCSETVTWFVLKIPAEMSARQFHAFQTVLGNDFRPLQDLAGRTVRGTAGRKP